MVAQGYKDAMFFCIVLLFSPSSGTPLAKQLKRVQLWNQRHSPNFGVGQNVHLGFL